MQRSVLNFGNFPQAPQTPTTKLVHSLPLLYLLLVKQSQVWHSDTLHTDDGFQQIMLCSAQFVEIVQIFMVTKGRKLAVLWINILPGSEKFWWYWKLNNFRSRTKTWEFACTVHWTLGRLHNSQFVNNLFTFISSCML